MFKQLSLSLILLASFPLSGCKQELPKKVEQAAVFGTATEMHVADNEKQLIYVQGQDPYTKAWGLAAGYYITVNGQVYKVHWDQADKFKQLKAGDRINLHPTEYISCVGEADLKPMCSRLMRIYKSERQISPLSPSKP